jgi:hypothetical protein
MSSKENRDSSDRSGNAGSHLPPTEAFKPHETGEQWVQSLLDYISMGSFEKDIGYEIWYAPVQQLRKPGNAVESKSSSAEAKSSSANTVTTDSSNVRQDESQ